MIYRDDDIGKFTDLTTIMEIQKVFDEYEQIHTVTILMEDLWESRGVWEWLVTTPNIDIALHGWVHVNHAGMSPESQERWIAQALSYWKMHTERIGVDIPIKVFYPPWNSWNDATKRACEKLGLEMNVCIDTEKVYNFHWWEFIGGRNMDELRKAVIHGSA